MIAALALSSCQFIKPLDGPGMEREVNDSLSSGIQDSVVTEPVAGMVE